MPPPLLEIEPDRLFEDHGISEIQAVQVLLQNEIENKREDLRAMVGEKYRDLLKAADTIGDMRNTSNNIISNIEELSKMCQTLQNKHLMGFKQQLPLSVSRSTRQQEEISRVVEMKILLSLPKEIWWCIDNKNYLLGAQFYLLAAHIHLNLKVADNAKVMNETFPVISKQWDIISSCRKVLVDSSKQEITIVDISCEKVVDDLVALLLLEVCSCEQILTIFLQLRLQTLEVVLSTDDLPTVKQKLCKAVQLLQHTMHLTYTCFAVNNKCGLFYKKIDEITSADSESTLSKLNQTNLFMSKYLSPIITEFHPKPTKSINKISGNVLQDKMNAWLAEAASVVDKHLVNLLKLITRVCELFKIRQEIFDMKTVVNWNDVVLTITGKEMNVWVCFMRKLVTRRVLELIEMNWRNIIENIHHMFTSVIKQVTDEKCQQPEHDVRWYVWRENDKLINDLHLKTLSYTPNIVKLTTCMDDQLDNLLCDISLYMKNCHDVCLSQTYKDDAVEIIQFMNHCTFNVVKQLAEHLKSKSYIKETAECESSLILKARFLQSLTNLCPNLEKCLKQTYQDDVNDNNSWNMLCDYLNEQSICVWRLWSQIIKVKYQKMIKDKLPEELSLQSLLKSKPQNEVVPIEEQTEEGDKILSELRVPSQPSLPLQDLLFSVCQHLNTVAPHTLPRIIHQELVDNLIKNVFDHYNNLDGIHYQCQSLQLLLDVKVLTVMFVSADNKELTDKSHQLCEKLEKTVDPFDLDVYYKHLQNNIKLSVRRLQGTLGILINFSEKLAVLNGLKLSTKTSTNEEPNILAVSTNIPWFSLLPISSPNTSVVNKLTSRENSPGFTSFPGTSSIVGSNKENVKKEQQTTSVTGGLNLLTGWFNKKY